LGPPGALWASAAFSSWARWTAEVTHTNGNKISLRGLTYYRLADGKIVDDDWIPTLDLLQEIGKLTPAPAAS
jgi:hypothetical protein